ncbi:MULTISPECIES: hypothetical protein [Streptacidiphilus]|uniref:Uncharacterized protein n=2 Tax=Streptacidiphilus TaxID=228398 RepID=A0ABV6ULJ2_9ACTN|nr:hypothetical protein [Streptacidiphilus jeojiense]
MSEASVVPEGQSASSPTAAPAAPQSLLAQMEQLLAALNADLVRLDADLQSPPPHDAHSYEP